MKKLTFNPFSQEPPKPNTQAVEGSVRERTAMDELEEGTLPSCALISKGYGGIVVKHSVSTTEAMVKLLNFAVLHRVALDPLLTNYGLLVEQTEAMPEKVPCIRRSTDGWTMLVPEAEKREHALLQITQAFLAIARSPLARALAEAGITPYRD